ncbi:MAG: enoyl-ACP reductase FabV [Spirochaetia bacterium]
MISPKIRGGICMNAHPAGCAREVQLQKEFVEQIDFSADSGPDTAPPRPEGSGAARGNGPKTVLIIGGSTGYGLASRLVGAFGYGAETISVSFEREATDKRPATAGWYNTRAFDTLAAKAGLKAFSFNADAFAHETRDKIGALLQERGRKVDLLVYSLASGVRPDPDTGYMYRSSLKPIGETYTTRSVDFMKETISEVSLEPAGQDEIDATVKVMGGEDWQLWVNYLQDNGLISDGFQTVAFSYIGPEVTHPIYRSGTIGKAKEHLEATARSMNSRLQQNGGAAYVSINKAVVTRASAVIPAVPLYISLLFSVMKEKQLHEGCIEQIVRMYRNRLYTGDKVPTDSEERIRLDDFEMQPEIQAEVARRWEEVTEENLNELADMQGFRSDFLRIHGFDVPGIDYEQDVDLGDIPAL